MKGLSPASQGGTSTRFEVTLRNIADRLRRIERRTPTTPGWTIGVDADGNLVATEDSTGTETIIATATL